MTLLGYRSALLIAGVGLISLGAGEARPQAGDPTSTGAFSDANRFLQRDGEGLYRAICQGCHMPDGRGAEGAGRYPPLASNQNLEAGGYPAYVVVKGLKGMPGFADFLDDEQVAAVVNYVRSHFGNSYPDPVTAEDVKASRQ